MRYRLLGATGLSVSAVSFGAGPVSGLMTGGAADAQRAVIRRAIELGVNWFDTAATYGGGTSEASLGALLDELRPDPPACVATKVRVRLTTDADLRPLVLASVGESLKRLRRSHVTLLQIHNAITWNRDDQPTSITPDDVLGPKGLLAGMEEARERGWADHLGLTGVGDVEALRAVMQSGRFAAIQAPFHILNPSGLRDAPESWRDPDYGGLLRDAHALGMGVLAIRVFAAGALLGAEPSAHTLTTPFFPLALYQRDQARAARLAERLGSSAALRELALRFVLSHAEISSAIVGFGDAAHVEDAARIADMPSLSVAELAALDELRHSIAAHSANA